MTEDERAQARREALEEAARVAVARAERNRDCPASCKCADGWHVAAAIRALKDRPAPPAPPPA